MLAVASVRDGHLVDRDVVTIKSDVWLGGVLRREGEQAGLIDPTSGVARDRAAANDQVASGAAGERDTQVPQDMARVRAEILVMHEWAAVHRLTPAERRQLQQLQQERHQIAAVLGVLREACSRVPAPYKRRERRDVGHLSGAATATVTQS